MGIFGDIGKALKGGVGVIGDVAKTAAPFAGMIPGIGTLGGAALGGLGTAASEFGHGQSFNLGDVIKNGAMGAAGGLAGKAMGGGNGILGKIGGALKSPSMFGNAEGTGLDLSKIIGTGSGIASTIGAQQQRKSAQNYNNAQIDQRNQLMSKILASPNTGLPSTPGAS